MISRAAGKRWFIRLIAIVCFVDFAWRAFAFVHICGDSRLLCWMSFSRKKASHLLPVLHPAEYSRKKLTSPPVWKVFDLGRLSGTVVLVADLSLLSLDAWNNSHSEKFMGEW
jgi:hypothetical protein